MEKMDIFEELKWTLVSKEEIDFAKFPITRYQGSKRKIVSWIYDSIKDLKFQTVLDGFGGSSTVSYLFKKMGKDVTYNDKLRFNYLIGKALIENQTVNFLKEDIARLKQGHSRIKYSGIITKNFRNVYYLKKENEWLDLITPNIVQMNHYTPPILDYKKAIAFYALFQACLIKRPYNLFHRKNLNLRTAEVERNFGNKTTWDRSFDEYLDKFINEANHLVFNSKTSCKSLNESIFDLDGSAYDLVYLDPPYLREDANAEASNYLSYYHFLEGLTEYDNWDSIIDHTKAHLPLTNVSDQNDFTKDCAKEKFEEMILKFRKSKIVLSYKKGGVPSIDHLVKVMKKFKKNVSTRSIQYSYALNKQNGNAKYNREVLIIGV
jgi:adenine-specific DNA-methyltransferase